MSPFAADFGAVLAALHGPGTLRVHRQDRCQHDHDPSLRLGGAAQGSTCLQVEWQRRVPVANA